MKKELVERVLLSTPRPQEMTKIELALEINPTLLWNKYINFQCRCLAAKKHYLIH